jgi:hypothetical protein
VNSIFDAQQAYDSASEDPALPYRDCHAWAFTPKSFELLMLELNLLGHVDWSIRSIEQAVGVEFYVWLARKRVTMPEIEANSARLSLLTATVYECRSAIAQLDRALPAADVAPEKKSGKDVDRLPHPAGDEAGEQGDIEIGDMVVCDTAVPAIADVPGSHDIVLPDLDVRAIGDRYPATAPVTGQRKRAY